MIIDASIALLCFQDKWQHNQWLIIFWIVRIKTPGLLLTVEYSLKKQHKFVKNTFPKQHLSEREFHVILFPYQLQQF